MIHKSIEIVSSSDARLSSMSKRSREAIRDELSKYYDSVIVTLVSCLEDLEFLVVRRPDLVFLGMNFVPTTRRMSSSPKIWLSKFLDEQGIAQTGSHYLAHILEHNKDLAKQCVIDAKLPTSAFMVIKIGDTCEVDAVALRYPLFVKPTNRGGGVGIDANSVVRNFSELTFKVRDLARTLGTDALIEEYLPGREFSVAILKDTTVGGYYSMPLELVAPIDSRGARLLSEEVKSADVESVLPVVPGELRESLCTLAVSVFKALGARDYGRIDIRLDKNGQPQFLEANLLPSLLEGYGNFPKACLMNKNIGYSAMLRRIVSLCSNRNMTAVVKNKDYWSRAPFLAALPLKKIVV